MIVVDTNVLASALLEGEETAVVRRVFARDADWAAPQLARSELRNVLVGRMRRGAVTLADALDAMEGLDVALAGREFEVGSDEVLSLAAGSRCTAYDCEFVALARQLRVDLITFDQQVLAEFPETAVAPEAFAAGS